ncbi:beta strand repeat-containing protein [Falsiroseomonas ponticola]|uniref:beta strand repeat-containing protein n=1 Tax=Falsiroseomonas ponticola TaxID=2786951 RepID=UPI0019315085|nr:calcium-binding protein [Roseomonas ponticola]
MATISGSSGADIITPTVAETAGGVALPGGPATANADSISGLGGDDTIDGGDGNDTIIGGAGADSLVGGTGTNTLSYAGSTVGVAINLLAGTASGGDAEGDVYSGFIRVMGGSGADTLTGDAGANTLEGADGNDVLVGGDGNDVLLGGNGDDTFIGGAGSDLMNGGAGFDVIDYSASAAAVSVNINGTAIWSGGDAAGDRTNVTIIPGMEGVIGSAFGDSIIGNAFTASLLVGGEGNDSLRGSNNADTLNGGAGDDYLLGGNGNDIYIGGAGNDTFQEDSAGGFDIVSYAGSTAGMLALRDNYYTPVTNTFGDGVGDSWGAIEGVQGSAGDDTFVGNASANYFDGAEGADSLVGGAGADTLIGGAGFDVIGYGGTTGILANLATNTFSSGEAEGDSVVGVEGIRAGSGADTLVGNGSDNRLEGGEGNDYLTGGAGADTLVGGAGFDVITYAGSAAVSVDLSTGTFSLGHAAGDQVQEVEGVQGGSGNDTLTGSNGGNLLDGSTGADLLIGLGNNDIYVVDNIDDVVVEAAGGGLDEVRSSITWTLGSNLEYLTLLGSADVNGKGNELDNTIRGNSGANILKGMDGKDRLYGMGGADTMEGGAGNDSYYVSSSDTKLLEDAGGGTDTAYTTVTFTLGAEVEVLVLQDSGDIGGTGNAGANRITGNAGHNLIDGAGGDDVLDGGAGNDSLAGGLGNDNLTGGTGADSMNGGAGNDRYEVDNTEDTVTEAPAEGIDLVRASVSFTLSAAVENLTLLGTGHLSGTGNEDANAITGNAGNNLLVGLGGDDRLTGGDGADTLVGGSGADVLTTGDGADILRFLRAGDGIDFVADYVAASDGIEVSAAGFGGGLTEGLDLSTGNRFIVNTTGKSDAVGHGQFIFESDRGLLWWDADGAGGAAAVSVARFGGLGSLSASEFTVIA